MKRTENLNLPIYDNPESDIFKINDVNSAHETIDKQYKELKNIKETVESTNPSANLQGQINDINASLDNMNLKNSQFINASEFGVIGDFNKATGEGTDNTKSLQNAIDYCIKHKKHLLLDGGNFKISEPIKITSYSGFRMTGVGLKLSRIYQDYNNTPIFEILGEGITLDGIGIEYTSLQPKSNANSVALALVKVYNSKFTNMYIANSCIGIGEIADTDGSSYAFSISFDNIEIQASTKNAINLTPLPLQGAGNTGSTFNNIYINNQKTRGSSNIIECEEVIRIDSMGESFFNQVNVEWIKCKSVFKVIDSNSLGFSSIHIEGGEIKDDIFNLTRVTGFNINTCYLQTTKATGSWKFNIFYTEGNVIGNINNLVCRDLESNGKQLYRFYSILDGELSKINVDNIYTDVEFMNDRMNDSSIINYLDNRIFRKNYPTDGIYRIGDISYNKTFESGFIGYVCTRGGRTGIIRKNVIYVDSGTYMVLSNNNGRVYKATTSGVTASSEPTFTENIINDGAIIWEDCGVSAEFKKFGAIV